MINLNSWLVISSKVNINMNNLRQYVRKILLEVKLKNISLQEAISNLEQFKNYTWVFFDTETLGLDPNYAQITEIAAVAVNISDWENYEVLDKFHIKAKLGETEKKLLNNPESGTRKSWEKWNAKQRRKLKEPQDLLRMTRYGEKNAPFIDEQEMYLKFRSWLDKIPNPIFVAQNARFDLRMVNHRSGRIFQDIPVIDTLVLIRDHLIPVLKELSSQGDENASQILDSLRSPKTGRPLSNLGGVAKAFGIKATGWHSAIADVEMMIGSISKVIKLLRNHISIDVSKEQTRIKASRAKRRRAKKSKGYRRQKAIGKI